MAINPFLALLQSIGAGQTTDSIGRPDLNPEAGPDIAVSGSRRPQAPASMAPLLSGPIDQEDVAPIRLGNRDFIQQGLQDQANSAPGVRKDDLQHKGMFGVKGTLRDVIGMLGDAFLVNSGKASVYAPQREKERMSDALAGFTQGDPRAAPERLAAAGFGKEAQDLYDKTFDNKNKQEQNNSLNAYRKSQIADRFGKTVSNALAGAKTPQEKQAVLQLALQRGKMLGLDPADMGITPDMTPEEITATINSNWPVNQQATLPIQQQNADTAAGRLVEAGRHNRTGEGTAQQNAGTNAGRLGETRRHNGVLEPIAQQNADSNTVRANKPTKAAPAGGGPQNGMRRVINGKLYEWQNGKAVPIAPSNVPLAK